jgi:hypothetical protein
VAEAAGRFRASAPVTVTSAAAKRAGFAFA